MFREQSFSALDDEILVKNLYDRKNSPLRDFSIGVS